MLGKYYSWGYHDDCDNQKATKGVASAAQALMKLYVYDCPYDIEPEEGVAIACKWYDRWIEILKAKADKGDIATKKKLADILYYGTGVPDEVLELIEDDIDTQEDDAALLYSEVVVGENDAEGWCNLGQIYSRSESENDLKKSLDCYMKSSQLGYKDAYRCVGGAYFEGRGVEKDLVKAREWYRQGADAGDVLAWKSICGRHTIGSNSPSEIAILQLKTRSTIRSSEILKYETANIVFRGRLCS